MLGGGGAILAVPMLVYIAKLDPKSAIATSLFCVGVTSAGGALVHARSGNVRFRTGAFVGGAAMLGAFGGARLAHFVTGDVLLVVFGVLMVASAIALLARRPVEDAKQTNVALGRAILIGLAVGTCSGFVGAGGGFLLVPALAIFGGLTLREAIGTSLFIIALQAFAGFAGHVSDVKLDVPLMLIVTSGAAIGSFIGASLGKRIQPSSLRQTFAWLVIAMGVFVFFEQLPRLVAAVLGVLAIGLALVLRQRGRRAIS